MKSRFEFAGIFFCLKIVIDLKIESEDGLIWLVVKVLGCAINMAIFTTFGDR